MELEKIGVVKITCGEKVMGVVPNIPGNELALQAYAQWYDQKGMDREAIRRTVQDYSAILHQHSSLEFLTTLPEGETLTLTFVTQSSSLLSDLVQGKATKEQKQEAVTLLDQGKIRCAEKIYSLDGLSARWHPQLYAIDAMNGAFTAFDMKVMNEHWYDKVPLKTERWMEQRFQKAGVRFIPGSFVRFGAYVGSGTTIMPGAIVNTGAYVAGEGVMIDGGARVATGAQVGKGVKLGAGSGIEGILEPRGRLPSIIEDKVKIGANCEIASIVEEGAVLGSGVIMSSGKKIFDLRTGQIVKPRYMKVGDTVHTIPYIPAGRVAVAGTYEKKVGGTTFGVDCILLLEKNASDTSLVEMPRNPTLYL